MDRFDPKIRERRQCVGPIRRRDADDVGKVVVRRIMPTLVVVSTVIAGGGNEQDARIARGAYRILESFRVLRRSPTGVNNPQINARLFAVDSVIDRFDGICRGTETAAS